MTMQLNSREKYKEFFGRVIDQMPKLISDKRNPLNTAQVMDRRLQVKTAEADVQTAWTDNYFDTSDVILYHPDGKVKLVLDSQHLRDLTAQSPLRNGALVLPDGVYETLKGDEFSRKELERCKFVEHHLKPEQVKSSPIWQSLSFHDKPLLNSYVDYVFSEYQRRIAPRTNPGYSSMGIFINDEESIPKDVITMRAWRIEDLENGSSVWGCLPLNNKESRLVGITLEAFNRREAFQS